MFQDFMSGSDYNIRTFELFLHRMYVTWFYSNLYNNVILGVELSPLAVSWPRNIVNTSLFIKFVYKISLCLKINQTVYELQGHCNFFAQCALVASQRQIDMKDIIGHCKLSSVCGSFMDSGGELNHGDEAKSKLVDILIKHVSQSKIPASECPSADIVAIDAI